LHGAFRKRTYAVQRIKVSLQGFSRRTSRPFSLSLTEGLQKGIVFCSEIADNIPMKKILVVEDEEGLRLLYQEELEAEGYEIITARNGKEAIQKLEEGKPDLIILDIVMPVMDGMEALGRIVGKDRKIPIILNTSYSGYREDFMSWVADAYVTKSSDLEELKTKVKELLEKGKAR